VLAIAVIVTAAIPALPRLVRVLAIARIQAATGRSASIDALDLDLRRGTLSVRGVRLADRDGGTLGTIGRLEARITLRALLRGHLWLRELAVKDSTVRVVRFEDGSFNISDLIGGRESGGRMLDVTVDRFTLADGTVLLEDRGVSPRRVWKSEDLTIVARNVSTRRGDGEAEASSTIDGAPVSVHVEQLRLVPVHLRAVIRAQQVDLAVARVYIPTNVPVTLDRGRLDTTVTVALDAHDGLHVDADGRIADALVVRRRQGDPVLIAPAVRVAMRGFSAGTDGALALDRMEVDGATTLVNGDAVPPARFELPRMTLRAEALAWPVRGPARVALDAPVPGGGRLTVRGDVQPRPASAAIDVRLTRVNLAPWARYVAPWLRVTGRGEIALRVHAALQPALTATGNGVARVSGVTVADGDRRLVSLAQAEASGLELKWPSRLTIGRIRVRRPEALVERDASGAIVIPGKNADVPDTGSPPDDPSPSLATGSRPTIVLGELLVDDGAVTWRDLGVKPQTTVRLSRVRLVAKDATWPMSDPVAVQLRAATPDGGAVRVDGRVSIEPLAADVQLQARGVAVAPYAAYLPVALPVQAYADAALSIGLSRDPELRGRVRGTAALSRVAVVDGKRRVLSAARLEASGLDVDWPETIAVDRITLRQPWVLVERDEQGAFPLLAMLTRPATPMATMPPGAPPGSEPPGDRGGPAAVPVAVRELVVEDAGARVVDRSISPPYADDVSRLWLRARGIATGSDTPIRLDLRAALGPAGVLLARGTIAALEGPLALDLAVEARDLAIPRLNPYLRHFSGWNATSGRFSTKIVCRVSGGELAATNDVHLGRLQVARAAPDDAGRERIGLPLGLVVGLLKDRRGNIELSLPVGGSLRDPHFQFSEAIWTALRAVAIKTIALPVSWIGRLRFTKDSKIEDVEIDPLVFQTGTATVAAESTPRLERLTAFLETLPDVRMILTPVISVGDLEALKTRAIESRIKARAAERKISEGEAADQLFAEQFGGKAPPGEIEETIRALREVEEPPAAEAGTLAKERARAVRDALTKAGIDGHRIALNKDVGALETFDPGRVEFGLTDALKPRRTLADLLRALVEVLQRRLGAVRATR
jgi:hypothetical protein